MMNNYPVALRRYNLLRKQLAKTPALEEMYKSAIKTMIDNNEVELINESTATLSDPSRYLNYLPHLAVVKLEKTSSRIRPVFDASARNSQGVSLNSNLLAGPKTQLQIPYLMTHLRMNPIVLIGDIRRIFFSIKGQKTLTKKDLLLENVRDLYRLL